MKVVLDLTKLLKENKISQAEFDRLSQYSMQSTSSLAFNLLLGFGVIAISLALFSLVPSAHTCIVLGAILVALGSPLFMYSLKWNMLGQICITIGALVMCGGILWVYNATFISWVIVTILLLVGAIALRHGLLMVLAILSLSEMIGASAAYAHATYMISIDQPTVTIIIFVILSLITYWLSKKLDSDYERIAVIASRTSIFLVNLGFWVGSLWGDELPGKIIIPDWLFALVWAIALIGVGIWGARKDKRWVVNIAAVFGGIHFYSQWFERLGATPGSVLIAGILAIVFALLLRKLNSKMKQRQ